ncbi:unnamed protein product [Schistocephalus solidus]|uniref:C2H2-type domain-containing protein n=1 Tax=Schistocephalus solidus TaxID=70667 RepID=A0A183T5L8_SCHSO|nr:unnamed protein product [Schistocephalus solidus]
MCHHRLAVPLVPVDVNDGGILEGFVLVTRSSGRPNHGVDQKPQDPRHVEATETAMERPPGQKRSYKDTLKKSLKQLQINPATWKDVTQDRPAWRRSVKTGAVIYEANRIAAAKAKRVVRKSQAPRTNTANGQALPKCPRCQRTFRARIGLDGHIRTRCNNNPTTSTSAKPASDPTTTTTPTTDNNLIDAQPPTITDTILRPPLLAPITATNTSCPTPTTSVATSDYLPFFTYYLQHHHCPQYQR